MQSPKELTQKIEALQDRISRLNSAILRISRSLDVGTVLQEVVESARDLTGARYGLIATIDESGQVQEFVSSGFTAEEHKQMTDWPEGPLLYEHFRELSGAVRLRDLPAYVRSVGYSSDLLLSKTFQGTPMRHRDVQVGNFFLAEKEGGQEFTSEDEEVMVLFASQAAAAIANARTHGDVHRARADLEALIDMSPVGVVVFDARTGRLVMVNREAKRIADSLHTPSLPLEQMLEVVKFRRADGREFSLEEWPLDQALKIAETVRVEEIVLEVPDGRSVTTLINATPIRSEAGAVESMVVTVQDLAPLEDLERSRAEFLGMVSHELRAPLTSIKGSAATVLDATPLPNPAEMLQFFRIINEQAKHMHGLISDLLDAEQIETGTLSVSPAPEGVASIVDEARKTFLSGGRRHIVQIDLPADLPRVLADRQRIVQVLNNLLYNASRYAPESSPIRVGAVQDGLHVAITVSDKGSGVPADLLPQLFRKHVSVGGKKRGMRGSGLGLAICKGLVEAHGGRIRAESAGPGRGTQVTFTIPVAEEFETGAVGSSTRGISHPSQEGRGRPRILVVDDDPETLRYIRHALTAADFSPLVTGDPQAVSHLIRTKKPQLVLLDLILPGIDGIELMERLPELSDLPVIFISAYGRDETIVRALEIGATDYVVKPFSPAELVARVQAALRRHQAPPEAFHLGELTIHYDQRRVTLAGRPVPLTATEYELLRVLSVNAGWVMTYDVLLRRVWGRMESGDSQPVRTFVKKLRRKLGDDAANSTYIFNVRGVGYRMATPGDH
ncbi:MAG: response regulator [Candidatus Aminicenantes bacterium]|nr:response regulator [Candidatus Aminicenantes bacterium]